MAWAAEVSIETGEGGQIRISKQCLSTFNRFSNLLHNCGYENNTLRNRHALSMLMSKMQCWKNKTLRKVSLFNQPIKCDYGYLYQLLLPFKAYHFKLNLANGPVQRDWANLKALQWENVPATSCIVMLLLLQHLLMSIFSSFSSI